MPLQVGVDHECRAKDLFVLYVCALAYIKSGSWLARKVPRHSLR